MAQRNGHERTSGLHTAFRQYLQWHRIEGHTQGTVRACQEKVGNLLRWLAANHPDVLEDPYPVKPLHISGWLLALQETCGPFTIKTRFTAARAFFNWLEDWEFIPEGSSPFRRWKKAPKTPKKRKPTPTTEDLKAILALCPPATLVGARRRSMVLLFATTGMRHKEMAELTVDDIDLEHGFVRIKDGKGQKERRVPLHREAMRALHRYLSHRKCRDPELWMTQSGKALTWDGVYQDMARLMERAGLKDKFPDVCHAWRRRFAEMSVDQGMGPWEAITVGGWSGPQMLDYYTKGLADEERAAEQYRGFNPFK